MRVLYLLAVTIWALVGDSSFYPPPSITGVTNPAVTQANLKSTVCSSGYTATIRPTSAFTTKLKILQMGEFGLKGKPGDYEEDHFISLEIGGNPTDSRNLWPEPYKGKYGARLKDQVEDALHRELCSGKMTLEQVQSCISKDWVACGIKLGLKQFP